MKRQLLPILALLLISGCGYWEDTSPPVRQDHPDKKIADEDARYPVYKLPLEFTIEVPEVPETIKGPSAEIEEDEEKPAEQQKEPEEEGKEEQPQGQDKDQEASGRVGL